VYYLGIDQGTSGTAVAAFDEHLRLRLSSYRPIKTFTPAPGRAEQQAAEIVDSVTSAVAEVLTALGTSERVAAAGIANQGESVVCWDSASEWTTPVVLWSDERGADLVDGLRARGLGSWIEQVSGLPLSPYFSAAKLSWLLQRDSHANEALRRGTLRCGTLDSFLGWKLGDGVYLTDHGTASRTQLLGLNPLVWNAALLEAFSLPPALLEEQLLPRLQPSLGDHGSLRHGSWPEVLPWYASLVDQPAALAGNGCFALHDLKITYGTGCFVVRNAGPTRPTAANGLATSIAWTDSSQRVYARDGGVFSASSALQWLTGLGLLRSAQEASQLAASVDSSGGVRFLPALAGLGAPWWRPRQRAILDGLTAASTPAHIVRAVLDGIAFRVCDIVRAVRAADGVLPDTVRVDGGLSACEYLMRRQADLLGVQLQRGSSDEATVFGAAALAALATGAVTEEDIAAASPPQCSYEPRTSADERESEYSQWLGWLRRVAPER